MKRLLPFLFLKAVLISFVILYGSIELGPDEAQYFTWSQRLQFGYYSKPMGVALQIYLGVLLFGKNEFGVRFFSLVFSLLTSVFLYLTAKQARFSDRGAFFAALMFAIAPLGMVGSLFAITDSGMILFWTLALYFFYRDPKNILPTSLMILFGALFKWPIYFFWLFVFYFGFFSYRGFLLSLLGLLPSLYWNMQNNFATFRHVFKTVTGAHGSELGASPLFQGNFFDFIGAQIILLSPVLFFMAARSFLFFLKNKDRHAMLAYQGFVPLILYAVVSIFMKMQGNWASFCYPALFLYLAYVYVEKLKKMAWVYSGLFVALLLSLSALFFPEIQNTFHIPFRKSPFKHNVGYRALQKIIDTLPKKDFLMGDKYQSASILSFYNQKKEIAFYLNLFGARQNQFDYWPFIEKHQSGYFIAYENREDFLNDADLYKEKLLKYFRSVKLLGSYPLYTIDGKGVKVALIFEVDDYSGKPRKKSESF